ncbi:hypothetical protein VS868_00255 [Salinimicrobium sp. 3283s]|uniref:hypothetical protein n=1 Tax=Salinimicrobium sp. 3283s TaxID=3114359 RepID=UPI0031EED86B
MKNIIPALFLLFTTILFAQKKIYMNEKYEVVTNPAEATFYKIEEKTDEGDAEFHRVTYRINGDISAEQYLSIKDGKPVKMENR